MTKALGKKMFLFKDEVYDLETLTNHFIDNYYEEDSIYKEGTVLNQIEQDEFNIVDIIIYYENMSKYIIDQCESLSYETRGKMRHLLSDKIVRFKIKILLAKLETDIITEKEVEELILLEDGRDVKKEIENKKGLSINLVEKFVKLNTEIGIPRTISLPNIGRYHLLLELLVNKNKIYRKPDGRSKEPSKTELMALLECKSNSTFSKFMQELEQANVSRRFTLPDNRKIIFINPLYAHKDLVISRELYNVFKDVFEKELDKKYFKYLEFVFDTRSGVGGTLTYKEDK